MHIPVNIEIKSNQSDENKIKNFLMPNKLIYVQDIYIEPTNVVGKVTIRISGIVFDNQDIPIIETDLKSYGDVKINKGSIKILTHHNNGAEIVPLVEYLVRRSSGQYHASHPSWYRRTKEKRIHRFGHAAVRDSIGDTFGPKGLQQQTPFQSRPTLSPPSESQPPSVSPYPTDRNLC